MPNTSKYQAIRPLRPDEREMLTDSIRARGIVQPILVDEAGDILDGHHRAEIAHDLGLPCPMQVVEGLSEEEKRILAVELNVARRQLTDAEKTALGRRIEPDVAARTKQRKVEIGKATGGRTRVQENFPEPLGQTRDEVAKIVGLGSGRTYENDKKVLEEAEAVLGEDEVAALLASGTTDLKDLRREVKRRRPAPAADPIPDARAAIAAEPAPTNSEPVALCPCCGQPLPV